MVSQHWAVFLLVLHVALYVYQACAAFAASFLSLITGYSVDPYTAFSAEIDLRYVRPTETLMSRMRS